MRLPMSIKSISLKKLTIAFAAAAGITLPAAAQTIDNAPHHIPADSYTVLGTKYSSLSEGVPPRQTLEFYSALLRNDRSNAVLQCHFAESTASAELIAERGYDHSTIYVQAMTPGSLAFADALRPALNGPASRLGSCLPYESPLTPEQLAKKAPLPVTRVSVGHGDTSDLKSAAAGDIFSDPLRERRLEAQYWHEKLNNKPGSPLPMVQSWTKVDHFRARGSACEGTGNTDLMEQIEYGFLNNKPVTGIPLRAHCPDLR